MASQIGESQMGANVFLAYSREDEYILNGLLQHLAVMKRSGLIHTWHDREIVPGEDWDGEIFRKLNDADLIVLLISASFFASDFCYTREMMSALERHEDGTARVIPVIARSCDWKNSDLGKIQALPTDAKAIQSWSDKDEAYMSVVSGLRESLEQMVIVRKSVNHAVPDPQLHKRSGTNEPETTGDGKENGVDNLDDDELGILDFAAMFERSFEVIVEKAGDITSSLNGLTKVLAHSTDEVNSLSRSASVRDKQKIVFRVSSAMNQYADKVEDVLPSINASWEQARIAANELLARVDPADKSDVDELRSFILNLDDSSSPLAGALESIDEFAEIIPSMKGIDRGLNRSVGRVANATNATKAMIEIGIKTFDETRAYGQAKLRVADHLDSD
jgi:hypothetical protein